MKIVDKYVKYKSLYNDYVCLIKSGNFYYTFGSDAYILNHLFGYQVRENKVGFPLSAKAKVKSVLNRHNINVVEVIDNHTYILEAQNTNAYNEILEVARSNQHTSYMINSLMDTIEAKIRQKESNYKLIKEFVDEL